MALRSDWSEDLCPIRRSLDVLGDPWVLLIVRDVLHGRRTFEQLRRNLGISDAVLSRRLRSMQAADLLTHVSITVDGRARAAYGATASAAELLPVLQQLAVWGERHTTMPKGGGHMALIHETCGHETVQGQVCSSCGVVLQADQMTWVKPWNGRRDTLVGPAS